MNRSFVGVLALVGATGAITTLTGAVTVTQPDVADLFADAGAGAIGPRPQARIQQGTNYPGPWAFQGGGFVSNAIGTWGSTNSGFNFAAVGSQPEFEFIKNPYPDGGCQRVMNFSLNDTGELEFNTASCDGSSPQTQCDFMPASGGDFVCGANGGSQLGGQLGADGVVADKYTVPSSTGNQRGVLETVRGFGTAHQNMGLEWNLWTNGTYPDGGYHWEVNGDGIGRPAYAEFMGDVLGFGEGWGIYAGSITGTQDTVMAPVLTYTSGNDLVVGERLAIAGNNGIHFNGPNRDIYWNGDTFGISGEWFIADATNPSHAVSLAQLTAANLWRDAGVAGAIRPATGNTSIRATCPLVIQLTDGGTAFVIDCDGSIDYSSYPTMGRNAFGVDTTGLVYGNGFAAYDYLGNAAGLTVGTVYATGSTLSTPTIAYQSTAGLLWRLNSGTSTADLKSETGGVAFVGHAYSPYVIAGAIDAGFALFGRANVTGGFAIGGATEVNDTSVTLPLDGCVKSNGNLSDFCLGNNTVHLHGNTDTNGTMTSVGVISTGNISRYNGSNERIQLGLDGDNGILQVFNSSNTSVGFFDAQGGFGGQGGSRIRTYTLEGNNGSILYIGANTPTNITALTPVLSSVASGSDAFQSATGARWHYGGGTTDYATSDGTKVTYACPVTVTGDIKPNDNTHYLGAPSGQTWYGIFVGPSGLLDNSNNSWLSFDGTTANFNYPISVKKLNVPGAGGAADTAGTATLVAGTVTVSTTAVTANSRIFLTHRGTGTLANFGTLYQGAIVAGTSFVIDSAVVIDNDAVSWFIVN